MSFYFYQKLRLLLEINFALSALICQFSPHVMAVIRHPQINLAGERFISPLFLTSTQKSIYSIPYPQIHIDQLKPQDNMLPPQKSSTVGRIAKERKQWGGNGNKKGEVGVRKCEICRTAGHIKSKCPSRQGLEE